MRWWAIYWAVVIVIAISAILFLDFMISGISMLVFLLIIANIRFLWERSDRTHWQNAAGMKHNQTEAPTGYLPRLPDIAMVYINFKDGTTKTIMNLETDYKVGENMKFYQKNKQHNRWDEIPDVDSVEFYIYEMDEVTPKPIPFHAHPLP